MRRWGLWLFILSLALRVVSLGIDQFWYDEAFTAYLVKLPFPQMIAAIQGDVHPPLWYAIEWPLARLAGRPEFVMRLPAAIFGALAVLEIYRLVKGLSGEMPARWASGLMAVLPAQLYYSQEARMYSLLTLLVLMGARAIQDRRWLRLALCCALIGYTQTLGLMYAAILGLWGLWASRGRALRHLVPAGLAYLPWSLVTLRQAASVAGGFWLPARSDPGSMLYFLGFTTFFTRLPDWLLAHAAAVAMILTLVALVALRGDLKKLAPILALAFAPSALLYVVSALWHPLMLDRALLPAGTMVIALWGMGLSRLSPWSKKLVAAISLPMLIAAVVFYYVDPVQQRARQDPVLEIVQSGWRPGDALYHLNLSSAISYDYYLPGKPAYLIPEAGDLAQSLSDPTKIAMGLKQREIPPGRLPGLGYRRMWLFIQDTPVSSDFEVEMADQLTRTYRVVRRWEIYSSRLATFSLVLLEL